MIRHERAVAAVSARYLAHGFSWERDRRPATLLEHQTDGVARRGEALDFVEVELTPKTPARYRLIFESHGCRVQQSELARVVYLCTPDAARTVRREAARWMLPQTLSRLVAQVAFDVRGVILAK